MANDAVIIELIEGGVPVRFTIADGDPYNKGRLMEIKNPRLAYGTWNNNDEFIGITCSEKVANDGSTSIALWTKGIFDLGANAAVVAGERVTIGGNNLIRKVTAGDLLHSNVGITLESSSGAETVAVFVGK